MSARAKQGQRKGIVEDNRSEDEREKAEAQKEWGNAHHNEELVGKSEIPSLQTTNILERPKTLDIPNDKPVNQEHNYQRGVERLAKPWAERLLASNAPFPDEEKPGKEAIEYLETLKGLPAIHMRELRQDEENESRSPTEEGDSSLPVSKGTDIEGQPHEQSEQESSHEEGTRQKTRNRQLLGEAMKAVRRGDQGEEHGSWISVQAAIPGVSKITRKAPLLAKIKRSELWVWKKDVKCYACNQEGYFARQCPPRSKSELKDTRASRKEVRCYACNQKGHFANSCPTGIRSKDTCYRCQQPGHFPRNCPTRPLEGNNERHEERSMLLGKLTEAKPKLTGERNRDKSP